MKLTKIFYGHVALLLLVLLLVGCTGGTNEISDVDPSANASTSPSEQKSEDKEESSQKSKEEVELESTTETDESTTENSNDTSSKDTKSEDLNHTPGGEEGHSLSAYSSEELEYARIWLQLGPNQEIDELHVRQILTGTPLNPDDDTSASYPEDVIQLAGSRLVDGSVTYSGNGDGTINVYNVPLRWDGNYPAGESFYTNIINNTRLVYVEIGNDEEIKKLINKMSFE